MSETTILYPPIVAPYLPAFDKTQNSYQIKFQLSSFNKKEDFKLEYTQIRIDHQNSNSSALSSQYTTGIKFVSAVAINNEDGWYSINIANTDFTFDKNKYYKVQIRMSGANIATPIDNLHSIEWEKNNANKCSAWSTVCLIKGIVPPTLTIGTFSSSADNIITTSNLIIAGTFQFETGEKEHIKTYQCNLYTVNGTTQTLVYTSNKIYSLYNTPNNINHIIDYRLKQGLTYRLQIQYETNNLFESSVNYNFIYSLSTMPVPKLQLSVKNDDNEGRLKILISTLNGGIIYNGLIISRSSNLTDFNIWEDVHIVALDSPSIDNYVWYDNTVQNGIYYKYSIQNISSTKVRSFAIETNEPVLAIFEDSFLTTADRQLNIKLNPQINAFSKKVAESITETLGSKYPFIRRNGNVEYKTFGLSGLISSFCDRQNLFTSPEELYGEYSDLYSSSEEVKNNYSNILYEKDFREKVIEFLYANNVKLFRSPTEGNILIKLTNISLTPELVLGRMLYSFSATAHEIADISIDNYIKYNILKLGSIQSISTEDLYAYTKTPSIVQLNQSFSANENILTLLTEKGKLNKAEYDENSVELDNICYIRIDFLDDIKSIRDNNGQLTYSSTGMLQGFLIDITFKDDTQQRLLVQPTVQIVTLEDNETKIGAAVFFEINEDYLYSSQIKGISFPTATTAFIDSALYFKIKVDTNDLNIVSYQNIIYKHAVGQEYGVFNSSWSFKNQLAIKYNTIIDNKQYNLNTVYYIYIEANKGTVVSIKLKSKDTYEDYIIENSNILEISDEIEDIKFKGQYYRQVYNMNPNEGEYYKTNIAVSSVDKIVNPIERYVYTVNNVQKIYLNQQFYDFIVNMTNIPTSALINYYYVLQEATTV